MHSIMIAKVNTHTKGLKPSPLFLPLLFIFNDCMFKKRYQFHQDSNLCSPAPEARIYIKKKTTLRNLCCGLAEKYVLFLLMLVVDEKISASLGLGERGRDVSSTQIKCKKKKNKQTKKQNKQKTHI